MTKVGRRTLLAGTAGLAAAAVLARPNIARAADSKTLEVWWNQGFYPAEDAAFHALVAEWEKSSGIKMNLSMVTGAALDQKVVSALTTGTVPDLIYSDDGTALTLPQAAWNSKLVDVSDVVETQKNEYSETALRSSQYFDNVTKKRSYFGVPFKAQALNIPMWRPLIEMAGYQMSDIPNTWDKFFAFFEPVQDKLRKKGQRHVYGLGYTISTNGADPNNLFNQSLIAYGGAGIVTPDGKLHADDAKVHKALVDTLNMLAIPYVKGYVPPSAVNWGDGDNNSAFHSKGVVMTPNDTISISTAVMDNKQWYYHDIVTQPMPHDNNGKPVDVMLSVPQGFIPKGAKNIDGAKDFLRYLIQPKNLGNYLKQARARWLPVMPSIVKDDPYWTNPKDPTILAAITQGVLGPTTVWPSVYNPAYAQVDAEYIWQVAIADVIHGMKADDAATKALKQATAIFAKYQTA
ncbi:MAG TPA: ABC transporter substrate-binding protein [Acetobacteraceae bacterium]|nr:ABC transporter substrate-binding protein [Acetobacteraceae bacterium]